MSCCSNGGASPLNRGRVTVFVVYTVFGVEDSDYQIFDDAFDRMNELGGGAYIRNLKRVPT